MGTIRFANSFEPRAEMPTCVFQKVGRTFLSAFLLSCTIFPAVVAADPIPSPHLLSIFPLGAKAGTEVDLTLKGEILEGDQQLVFSHPSIKASAVMNKADRFFPQPRPVENRFTVRIGADVPPGIYEVRLVNRSGISNGRCFVVGDLPETAEKEPNDNEKTANDISVNSVVNGVCDPQGHDFYRFTARKGQRLVIHCTAQQADSRTDPATVLYDAGGKILQQAHDAVRLDPTMDFVVPADGAYFISVHDFLYNGGDQHPYRLTVTTGPWIDFIDPPFASLGSAGRHTLYGRNLPGSTAADAGSLEKLEVTIPAPADCSKLAPAVETFMRPGEASIDSFSYRLSTPSGVSNPVRLAIINGPIQREQEPNDNAEKAQLLTLPAQIVGRFYPRNDRDWYTFAAKKGEKLWIEVVSQRLGLPTDPDVLIQQVITDKAGKTTVKELTEVDDQIRGNDNDGNGRRRISSDDPAILFTVPEDATYRILVRDLYGTAQGDQRFFYLLSVRPARPDFKLLAYASRTDPQNDTLNLSSTALRRGGTVQIDLLALRREGFDGEIWVAAESLPPGVSTKPTVFGPGDDSAVVVLRAAADAPNWAGAIQIVGRSKIDGGEITRSARPAEPTWPPPRDSNNRTPMRVVQQVGLAVRDDAALPYAIEVDDSKPLRMARGGKLAIPIKVTRAGSFKGEVKLLAVGLHRQMRLADMTIDGMATSKEVSLDIDPAVPVGAMSFFLRGEATVSYSRNSERATQATEDKKRIDALAAELTTAAQKATQARQEADQAAQKAAAALKQAQQQHRGVPKDSADALTKADLAVSEAEAQTKLAEAKRKQAAEAETKAKEESKLAADAKRQADERARAATDAARARDFKTFVPSPSVVVQVVPAPFSLSLSTADISLKAGSEGTELTAQIAREFGFDGEVRLEVQPTAGATGVKLSEKATTIAQGQQQAKLLLMADAKAKAGPQVLTLRARYKFNNRDMVFEQPLRVNVEAVARTAGASAK
jgi:hypothetical protein